MKWIVSVLISLSFINSTYALYFDSEVVDVIGDINQQELLKDSLNQGCANQLISRMDYSPQVKSKLMSECAFSLCGPPAKNKLAFSTNENFQQYVTPEIKKQLDDITPSLNQVLEKSKRNNLILAQALKDKVDGKIIVQPDLWSEWFKQQLSYDIFSKYFSASIDLTKPIDQRYSVIIDPNVKNLTPEFKKALEVYSKNYQEYVKKNPVAFLEKGLYTTSELKTIAAERLIQLKKIFNSNYSRMSTEDSTRISSDIFGLESYFKKEQVQGVSLFYFLNNIEKGLKSKVAPGVVDQVTMPTCADKVNCQKIYQYYIDNYNLSQVVKKFKNDLDNPKAKERSLNQCKANLTATLNKNADQKKAVALFNEVKKDMEKNVFNKFSTHSREILKEYFAKKILVVTEDFDIYGKKPADLSLATKKSIADYLKNENQVLPKSQEEVLKRVLTMGDNAHQFDSFMDKGSPCNSRPMLLASDSYVARDLIETLPPEDKARFAKGGDSDLMFVSDFACHNEYRGKAIIAHELGHAINHLFSRIKLSEESAKIYKDLRKCTTDNYIQFTPSAKKDAQRGDSVRTEEDQADLFSFMTYKDNSDLFSCAILAPTRDGQEYQDLGLDLPISDVHSTNFYRLLMDMINKQITVPVSCQKILDSESSRFRFKKCTI